MNDFYKITGIDPETNSVYIHFEYNNYVLDHTFFVDDITDAKLIVSEAQINYNKFVLDIDNVMNTPGLVPEVSSLIGVITQENSV